MAATTFLADRADRRIGDRLREVGQSGVIDEPTEAATVVRKARDSSMPAFDKLLDGSGLGARLAALIDQAGMATTPAAVIVFSLVLAGSLGFVALMLARLPLVALVAGLIGLVMPVGYLVQRRGARRRRF